MSERTQRAQRAERRAQALAMNTQSHDFTEEAPRAPETFRERHALKVMGAIGAVMFALVIVAQVGC